jgi:hypothetical protein
MQTIIILVVMMDFKKRKKKICHRRPYNNYVMQLYYLSIRNDNDE